MAYLLKYKQWEKLYESKQYGSKKYKRLYEQAFNSETLVQFLILGGTSPTPIFDEKLHTATGLPTGSGVALYEISMKDALNNNFASAKKVQDLNKNDINDRDRFQIVNEKNEVLMEIKGKGEILFTYDPKTTSKIRFSGNGVLAMHRAISEFGELRKFVDALNVDRHKGNIKIYMNFDNAPTSLSKSPRFQLGVTSLGKFDFLDAEINDRVAQALHYLVNDENSKQIAEKKHQSLNFKIFTSIKPIGTGVQEDLYNKTELKTESTKYLTADGPYIGKRTIYSELDSFKGMSPADFFKDPNAEVSNLYLKSEILTAIKAYVTASLNSLISDGGVIDQYYAEKLEGLDEPLINSIKGVSKKLAKIKVDALIANSANWTVSTVARIILAGQKTSAGWSRPTGKVITPVQGKDQKEGESGSVPTPPKTGGR